MTFGRHFQMELKPNYFNKWKFMFYNFFYVIFADFGVDNLVDFSKQTNFPWMMSNVYDNETKLPLADGLVTHIIEWGGKKVSLRFFYIVRKRFLCYGHSLAPVFYFPHTHVWWRYSVSTEGASI